MMGMGIEVAAVLVLVLALIVVYHESYILVSIELYTF
jgi:hypothetical protein